jgi:uncharacterized protein YbjT (DUF2867 family)
MFASPTSVLVVGATGGIGRRVFAAAQGHGLDVRALVRDPSRAERLLPGAELGTGDLEKPDTLHTALSGVDAVVFTHGGNGSPTPPGASTTAALPRSSAPSTAGHPASR